MRCYNETMWQLHTLEYQAWVHRILGKHTLSLASHTFFARSKKYFKKMVKNTKFIFETSHCKAENLRAIADLTQNADPHLFKAFCQIGFCVSCLHQKAGYDPGAKSHLIMDLAP